MLAERFQTTVQLRVEPVCLLDGRTQVIDHQSLRNAIKFAERVLQAGQERFRRLLIDGFAVRLAAVTQDHAEHMGPFLATLRRQHGRPRAEIDLTLLPRRLLQPAKRKRTPLAQLLYVATHAVAAREIRSCRRS